MPRLTVELVLAAGASVLLSLRTDGPSAGLWHLPGGTVRFGEPLLDAVARVALDEVGAEVAVERLLGWIEYPSHLARGLDWPIGIAFLAHLTDARACASVVRPGVAEWFEAAPSPMHDEQRSFLEELGLLA